MNKFLLDYLEQNNLDFSFQVWIKLGSETYRDGTFSTVDRLNFTPIQGVNEWYTFEFASEDVWFEDESDLVIHYSKIPSMLTNALKLKPLK